MCIAWCFYQALRGALGRGDRPSPRPPSKRPPWKFEIIVKGRPPAALEFWIYDLKAALEIWNYGYRYERHMVKLPLCFLCETLFLTFLFLARLGFLAIMYHVFGDNVSFNHVVAVQKYQIPAMCSARTYVEHPFLSAGKRARFYDSTMLFSCWRIWLWFADCLVRKVDVSTVLIVRKVYVSRVCGCNMSTRQPLSFCDICLRF